ncbi:MAG: sugar transferase [bacterium]
MGKLRILAIVIDVLLVNLALIGAISSTGDWEGYFKLAPYLSVISAGLFLFFRLYEGRPFSGINLFFRTGKAVIAAWFLLMVVAFLKRTYFYPSIFLISSILGIIFIFCWRLCFEILKQRYRRNCRILIVGAGKAGTRLARQIQKHPEKGYTVVGFIDDDLKKKGEIICGVEVLGGEEVLNEPAQQREVEEIIIAIPSASKNRLLDFILKSEEMGIQYAIVPSLYEIITSSGVAEEIGDFPILDLFGEPISPEQRLVKRTLDIVFSVAALIILTIPMLIIALIVKLSSNGPVLFKQKRIGRGGKPFVIYKFRSMVENASAIGPPLTEKNDPRITFVGRILRKTSLDELPQVINVLKGDMSLVGPRPEIPSVVKKYSRWQKRVLKVQPGITGLSQINGRGDRDVPEKLRLDMYYIKHQSLGLDLRVMLGTMWVVMSQEGAY